MSELSKVETVERPDNAGWKKGGGSTTIAVDNAAQYFLSPVVPYSTVLLAFLKAEEQHQPALQGVFLPYL